MVEKSEQYLRMLSSVLIDIRAAKTLRAAQIMADMFHYLPAELTTEHDRSLIDRRLLGTARRLEGEAYLARLFAQHGLGRIDLEEDVVKYDDEERD